MTSRELVRATIECKNPPRAARNLWALPWANLNYPKELKQIIVDFPDDFAGVENPLDEYPEVDGDAYAIGMYKDEWGCVFTNAQAGVVGEVKNPIIVEEEWEDADKIRFPKELLTVNRDRVNSQVSQIDKWVNGGCCANPFERLQYFRGSENLYVDLMLQPPKMLEFINRLHEFYCEMLTNWAKTDVDGLNIMDDWGAQRSLLINPELWRKIFKPIYRDYADIAHSHGKKLFMHSDGNILEIYPDLIEIGIDCLNSQLFCMGIDNLEQYAGKICFWGEMDRQNLLPFGTPEQIDAAVKEVHSKLWKNGGCIAQFEFSAGTKPANAYQTFKSWNDIFEKM